MLVYKKVTHKGDIFSSIDSKVFGTKRVHLLVSKKKSMSQAQVTGCNSRSRSRRPNWSYDILDGVAVRIRCATERR